LTLCSMVAGKPTCNLCRAEAQCIEYVAMKRETSGTVSDKVFRNVLYFVINSEHALSYSALGTALFTYAFSNFSTVFIKANKLAKSSVFLCRRGLFWGSSGSVSAGAFEFAWVHSSRSTVVTRASCIRDVTHRTVVSPFCSPRAL